MLRAAYENLMETGFDNDMVMSSDGETVYRVEDILRFIQKPKNQ